MTYKEISQKYNQLVSEENAIPAKMNEILKTVDSLKTKTTDLENKAQAEDLKISEKPAQIYQKTCGSAFLGIGKSCQEVPVPNPEIANEISIRNGYIRQKNSIISQIEANLKQIDEYTKRQTEIEKQEIDLRNQMLDSEQKILQQPFSILDTLGRAVKSLFTREQFQASLEEAKKEEGLKEKATVLLPYLAIATAVTLIFLFRRKKIEGGAQ